MKLRKPTTATSLLPLVGTIDWLKPEQFPDSGRQCLPKGTLAAFFVLRSKYRDQGQLKCSGFY